MSRIEHTQEIKICELIKNQAIKSIMQVVTQSRARENQILSNGQKNGAQITHEIIESPSVTFDVKKYDIIYFMIDDMSNIVFKKLQMHLSL